MSPFSGQATVELMLVLPVVLMLMLLLLQMTLVFRDQMALASAVREAARAASLAPGLDGPRRAAERVMPGVSVRLLPPRPAPGEAVTVEASFRSPTALPLIGPLLPDPELRARAVMRVEW
jgi:hypothetical protein